MDRNIEHLRREARYWRERRDLYRAKTDGSRVTSPTRMRELEASTQLAEDRLKHAERAVPDAADGAS